MGSKKKSSFLWSFLSSTLDGDCLDLPPALSVSASELGLRHGKATDIKWVGTRVWMRDCVELSHTELSRKIIRRRKKIMWKFLGMDKVRVIKLPDTMSPSHLSLT